VVLLGLARKVFFALLISWMIGCLAFFGIGFLMAHDKSLAWPVPWSDLADFVETADGRVLVSVRFYGRVLCYDRSSNFLGAYPYPLPNTRGHLAAGRDGRVFFYASDAVASLTPAWEAQVVRNAGTVGPNVWELAADSGQPRFAPRRHGQVPDRLLGPGDVLFAGRRDRQEFHCADGSVLRRAGNSLERISPGGGVTAVYGTPWFLVPFVFPVPGFFSWLAFFLLVAYRAHRCEKDRVRQRQQYLDSGAGAGTAVRVRLVRKTSLQYVFEVTAPEATYTVDYDRRGLGYETVHVNGRRVGRRWWRLRFRFDLGGRSAVIELGTLSRTLTFRIDGRLVYYEDLFNPTFVRTEQPPDSDAVLERHEDGVTITLQPVGFWRALARTPLCLLFWAGALAYAISWSVWQPLPWVILAVEVTGLLVSLFSGLHCLLYHLRHRVILAVAGDSLLLLETGAFRTRRKEWPREAIADVLMRFSHRANEVQLLPRTGWPIPLVSDRPRVEMEWIATVLRQALQLGEPVEAAASSAGPLVSSSSP
jgi:hypothetical protein